MKNICTLFISAFICLVSSSSIAQSTVSWNFGTAAGTASPTSGAPVSNLTISDVSQGNNNGTTPLLTTTSASTTYAGASGSYNAGAAARVGALNTATSGSAYFEFTLTPGAGYTVDLSAISFGTRSTGTGPQAYTVRTSLDSYGSDAATGAIVVTGTPWALKSNTISTVTSGAGTPVTIRIYGYNGAGSPSAGTANWRIDDLSITVNVNSAGPDVTPPTITTLSPANNATGVAINTNLQIVFNENIQKGTSGNIVIKKFSDNSIVQTIDVTTAAVSVSTKTATITINTLAYSTGYYVEIDAGTFKDIAGNSFAGISGNSIWKFDTQAADVTPPTITTLTPANNATAVALNTTLQVVFNENIQKGTSGNILIRNISDNSIVQTIAVTSGAVVVSNATATITISTLSYSTGYYIEIDAGAFQDLSANNFAGISGSSTWSFTTDAQPAAGVIGFNYNFNNCSAFLSQGFRQYSVTGTEIWTCTNFGRTYSGTGASSDSAIQMNGFTGAAHTNEDWLISPAYDLSSANSPYLRFYSRGKFAGNDLVLKVSTNYPGYGDPNGSTWTTLNGKFPATNTDVWTLSDSIYLTSYLTPNVHLAWVYTSTTAAASRWTLDDIRVSVGCTAPPTQPTALNLTPAIVSITGSFTAAAAPADAYLVVMSSSPTLSASPEPGTAYAIDDVIGNGTVVSIGNNLSFTVNNLNPATQYYFYVFAYSSAQSCYNLVSPLTGNVTTNSSPSCTPPTVIPSGLNGTVGGNSINLTWTRGNGDNILVVARPNTSINANPIVGVNYPAGSQVGQGNFVIYNGPASGFNYTGLTENTTYYFALYEYYNTNYCYNLTPLTGNFTTTCLNPVDVSSLNAVAGNTLVNLTWTNPNASCYNEILVVASNAPITGVGSDYTGPANSVYGGPNQVVYRGMGGSVSITGLTNGTTYYFKVFTKNGSIYSSGVSITGTPFDPASGFVYLYGNLHSHSSYSDGNKDDVTKKPIDDFKFARDANCLDFLGISEHNHLTAGLSKSNYPLGYADANTINGVVSPTTGNSIVTLWGMEWGVISGGGHVVTYGFDDQLIGWEAGNYDIFCAKNDYASLFNLIDGRPGAFATLAHPNSTDYTNLANTTYSSAADDAIVGSAIESGPAFSTDTTYSDFPSSLAYFSYYKTMLARGYHLGASMDGDNHNLTFGKQSTNRLVVMATSKSRADVMAAMRAMRFYASNDCNVKIDYKIFSNVMGSSLVHAGVPTISLNVTDPDAADSVSTISIYGGQAGNLAQAQIIKTYTKQSAFTFSAADVENTQPDNTTWYYFVLVTQQDGNKVIGSPIWYTRNDAALPVTLFNFTGSYNKNNNTSLLNWSTAQEINSKFFILERSVDGGRTFTVVGSVNAKGNSNSATNYNFTDLAPLKGTNLYRLKEVDIDGRFQYSNVVSIVVKDAENQYYSVYPNPAHQFTYVNSTSAQSRQVTIRVVDASGRILKNVSEQIDNGHPAKLNLDGISQGVYFIKIISDGTISTNRIIVK